MTTLGHVIETLEAQADTQRVIPHGFAHPHSYRGFYECLAFEPAKNVTVAEMLAAARDADGATYEAWKGGSYTMDRYSDVYLSMEGTTGDELSALLLDFMLADGRSLGDMLTLPPEPPEGTAVRLVGGVNDGQVWERVRTGLVPDATKRWQLREGISSEQWSRWSGLWWRLVEDDGDAQGLRIVPPPLSVGDDATTVGHLEALPDGAVVRGGPQRLVMEKIGERWWGVGNGRAVIGSEFLPARLLDLPWPGGEQG